MKIQLIKITGLYTILAISALLGLLGFGWMISRKFKPFSHFEERTARLIRRKFGNPQMNYDDGLSNSVLTFLATYGSPTFVSVLTVFIGMIFFIAVDRGLAIWLLGVVSSGGIFGIFLKHLFKRKRPAEHLPFDDGYAFPSGHAIASTLFFLAILLVFLPLVQNLPIRILLTGLGFLVWGAILFSRIYFHAHFVGDLLAGVSLGVFWVLASMNVYNFVVNIVEQFWIYQ